MWCIAQSDVDVEKIQSNKCVVSNILMQLTQQWLPDHIVDRAFMWFQF